MLLETTRNTKTHRKMLPFCFYFFLTAWVMVAILPNGESVDCYMCFNSKQSSWSQENCPGDGFVNSAYLTASYCSGFCFIRRDKGNPDVVFRGCSLGFYLPDRVMTPGCRTYNDQTWCMCDTDGCNGGPMISAGETTLKSWRGLLVTNVAKPRGIQILDELTSGGWRESQWKIGGSSFRGGRLPTEVLSSPLNAPFHGGKVHEWMKHLPPHWLTGESGDSRFQENRLVNGRPLGGRVPGNAVSRPDGDKYGRYLEEFPRNSKRPPIHSPTYGGIPSQGFNSGKLIRSKLSVIRLSIIAVVLRVIVVV